MPVMIVTTLLMMLATQTPDARVDMPAKPVPVAVLCDGDDGLTARLCDALKHDFGKSPDFTLEVAHKPRILIVRIPTNVGWKKVNGKAVSVRPVP
jgi:dienelactone hydrolase